MKNIEKLALIDKIKLMEAAIILADFWEVTPSKLVAFVCLVTKPEKMEEWNKIAEEFQEFNKMGIEERASKLGIKLLEDENEHIKTHKKFLKLAEKQEEWEEELRFTYGHLYYQNEEGEFCQIVNEIDDLIDFISKLLKEKTFSKEELNRLSIWSGDVGSFGVVSDEDAELINKIYKLLDGEKENE